VFAAGTFAFPTVTGDFSVTGLGFEPKMVVLFGGNQATEDTLLTGLTRPGIFLSLCTVDWDGVGIKTFCLSIAGNTSAHTVSDPVGYVRCAGHAGERPIRMQDSSGSGGIDYRASLITFDPDGFTLTVSHAAPGNRPIHWWAMAGDVVAAFAANTAGSFDTGFPIHSFLAMNGPATGGGDEVAWGGDSWLHFGTSHYPTDASTLDARVSATTHTGCLPSSGAGRQGFTEQFQYEGVPGNRVCHDLSAAGPAILSGYVLVQPDVVNGTEAVITNVGSITDYTHVSWMGNDGTAGAVVTPATIGNVTSVSVPDWFDRFDLVMFSTINGATASLGTAELRYGLGVLHPDYQGCVVMGADGSFYQSSSKCAARCTAAGAQAAEGTILGSTFELETVLGGSIDVSYHAFGRPELGWLPSIYRRVR
jgi:hypothetical protein